MNSTVKRIMLGCLTAVVAHAALLVVVLLVAAATKSSSDSVLSGNLEGMYLVYTALLVGLFSMIFYFRIRRRTTDLLPVDLIVGALFGQLVCLSVSIFLLAPIFDVVHFQNRSIDMWGVRFSFIALFLLHFIMLFVDFSICSARKKKQLEEDENLALLRKQWEADVAALTAS